MVKDNDMVKNFIFTSFMNYQKGLTYLNGMDIFILNNKCKYALGTKIFDYLYLNKPIFAFVEKDSAVWEFLRDLKNTFLIQNSQDFINAINKLINTKDCKVISEYELKQYSRKYQTKILFNYLIMFMENNKTIK